MITSEYKISSITESPFILWTFTIWRFRIYKTLSIWISTSFFSKSEQIEYCFCQSPVLGRKRFNNAVSRIFPSLNEILNHILLKLNVFHQNPLTHRKRKRKKIVKPVPYPLLRKNKKYFGAKNILSRWCYFNNLVII